MASPAHVLAMTDIYCGWLVYYTNKIDSMLDELDTAPPFLTETEHCIAKSIEHLEATVRSLKELQVAYDRLKLGP